MVWGHQRSKCQKEKQKETVEWTEGDENTELLQETSGRNRNAQDNPFTTGVTTHQLDCLLKYSVPKLPASEQLPLMQLVHTASVHLLFQPPFCLGV